MVTKGRIKDLQDDIDRIVTTQKKTGCTKCKGSGQYPGFTECPFCYANTH